MANLRVDKITSTETFETTGSVQFDGSGDYLKVAGSGTISDGNGDFTIEGWVYKNAGATNAYFFDGRPSTGAAAGNLLIYITGNTLIFYRTASHIQTTIELNKWIHIALTRESGVYKLWIDGSLKGTHTDSTSVNLVTTTSPILGTRSSLDDTYTLNGFISNFRIIKGKAIYTSNFKPPMRELELTPETIVLACQSKTDASLEKTGKTITVGGNAVANELTPGLLTPIVKSGGGSAITGSVEFDGNDDYLQVDANSDLSFTGDFTVEYWVYMSKSEANMRQIGSNNYITSGKNGNWYFGIHNESTPNVYFFTYDGQSNAEFVGATYTSSLNSWYHLAAARVGNTLTIYVNGVKLTSGTISKDLIDGSVGGIQIGRLPSYGYHNGFISNLRIVKGTALYTADFIPPTRELKKVPGTVLLCCQDPDSPLTEATGKTITGYGDLDQVYNTQLVPNGDFSNGTNDWSNSGSTATLSVSSGQMTITNSSGTNGRATGSAFKTTIGARYILKYNAITSGGSYRVEIREGGGAGVEQAFQSTTDGVTETFEFQATHSQHSVVIYSIGANGIATKYDNVHVYKVNPGKTGSNFTPQVGDDRQITFEGVTRINSDAYFYLPTGDTITRDSRSGRGLIRMADNGISYITISSLGNSQDFGDATVSAQNTSACASSTRGLFSQGYAHPNYYKSIDYVTIASTGNAKDFGDITTSASFIYGMSGCASSTRGLFGGGFTAPSPNAAAGLKQINYVTIASLGDSQDFGDLTGNGVRYPAATSSPTRGLFAGGRDSADAPVFNQNVIHYVTIATLGNALDFGDLSYTPYSAMGTGSSTRGIFTGGYNPAGSAAYDNIDYITIASTGNAQDFGNLTVGRGGHAASSNSTRATFAGGNSIPAATNHIDYITIASTGDALNFGDLMTTMSAGCGCSDSHGGLG